MIRNSKRVKISEEQDRISTLPDSVLSHILSFLPTKDAVRTTVLIPRFRNLWTTLQTLDFDQSAFHEGEDYDYDDVGPEYDEKFMNLIRHTLILHDCSSISKFRLRLRFCFFYTMFNSEVDEFVSREKGIANEIDTWVRFAVRKRVEVLDLELLSFGPEYNYLLPNVVFTNSYLTELNLASCDIKPRGQIVLKSLKKLSLKNIGLSDKIVDNIVSGCQVLEELSLRDCYGFSNLRLTHPCVKKLILIVIVDEGSQIFTLSCPYVVSLEIAGWIDRMRILDVSSVVADASLFFSYGFQCEKKGYGVMQMLLKKLSHSKNFTLCTWCILVFTIWQFLNLPCASFSWRSLVLKIFLTKWHQPGISLLLRKCPYLETLTMCIRPGWHSIYTGTAAQWIQAYDFDDAENYWASQESEFHCLKHHLKKVMIFGFITEPYVIQILKFILKSTMVLEELVISTKKPAHQYITIGGSNIAKQTNFTSKELLEFSQKLLSFPRASTKAVIHFS